MAKKVIIMGGGIAGMTAAHRLHPHHDITVFEANDYYGGHTATVDVERIRRRRFKVLVDANHGSGSVLGVVLMAAMLVGIGAEQCGHQEPKKVRIRTGSFCALRRFMIAASGV